MDLFGSGCLKGKFKIFTNNNNGYDWKESYNGFVGGGLMIILFPLGGQNEKIFRNACIAY